MFQVLVVGGDNRKGFFLPELLQNSFGNGAANLRLSASAKLIDEQERAFVGLAHHVFHVQQVTGVGREVVLDALFVAYVNHNVLKHTELRSFAHGN